MVDGQALADRRLAIRKGLRLLDRLHGPSPGPSRVQWKTERETEVSRSGCLRSVDQNLARDLRPTRLLPRIQLYRWR